MAQGDVINSGSSFTDSGTSTSPALGATATAGSLLVVAHYSGTNVNVDHPSGYTLGHEYDDTATRDDLVSLYWKVSDGTETDATVGSTALNAHIGIIAEIEGPWGEAPTVGVTATNEPTAETDPSSGTTATAPSDEYSAIAAWFANNSFRNITALSNSFQQAPTSYEENSATQTAGMGVSPWRTSAQTEECTATSAGTVIWMGIIFTIAPDSGNPKFKRRKKQTAGRSGRALAPGLNKGLTSLTYRPARYYEP